MQSTTGRSSAQRTRLVARVEDGRAVALVEGESLAIDRAAPEGSVVLLRRDGDRAVILKELAEGGSALAESHGIAAKAGFDVAFPEEVVQETTWWQHDPKIDDPSLEDVTHRPFVTIDSPGARDLDQAVHVSERAGGWLVSYAIADAAFYVRRGRPLWTEALRRGASYYLPGLTIPMLPRPLSERLVSLQPEGARRALLFEMEIDRRGQCVGTRLSRAKIRSRAKLSFADVQALHDRPGQSPLSGTEVEPALRALGSVGEALLGSVARDVVRYRRREIDVTIGGAKGERFVALDGARNRVELWNERISLLCNGEGAQILLDAAEGTPGVRPIFRVHPEPDPERVDDLEAAIVAIVRAHDLPRDEWIWDRDRESLAEYVARLPPFEIFGPDAPIARIGAAIQRQALLVNVRSTYASEPGRHHGTGFDPYARFSAPMREVVGVYLHGEAVEVVSHLPVVAMDEEALREAVILRANESKDVQRRINDLVNRRVLDRMFEPEVARGRAERRAWMGTVMGIDARKVHLQLDAVGMDVKLYLRDLGKAWRQFLVADPLGTVLRDRASGAVRLRAGDALAVRVVERDAQWDRWVLEPVGAPVTEPGPIGENG